MTNPGGANHSEPEVTPLELAGFQAPPEDQGLSLEELSTAYAELLQRGSTPYEEPAVTPDAPAADAPVLPEEPALADAGCDLSPRSILEAMLFVGNSHNEPLTARQVAALMRGVRPQEIDDLVVELNQQYLAEGCPYHIASLDAGYRLQLRDEYAYLRDTFYGRIKDARLTQQAIDVLAIVAYRQPMTREEVDKLRGRPCGAVLSQLVRRELLAIERTGTKPKVVYYRTTPRFLQVFGLESLEELPDSQDAAT